MHLGHPSLCWQRAPASHTRRRNGTHNPRAGWQHRVRRPARPRGTRARPAPRRGAPCTRSSRSCPRRGSRRPPRSPPRRRAPGRRRRRADQERLRIVARTARLPTEPTAMRADSTTPSTTRAAHVTVAAGRSWNANFRCTIDGVRRRDRNADAEHDLAVLERRLVRAREERAQRAPARGRIAAAAVDLRVEREQERRRDRSGGPRSRGCPRACRPCARGCSPPGAPSPRARAAARARAAIARSGGASPSRRARARRRPRGCPRAPRSPSGRRGAERGEAELEQQQELRAAAVEQRVLAVRSRSPSPPRPFAGGAARTAGASRVRRPPPARESTSSAASSPSPT